MECGTGNSRIRGDGTDDEQWEDRVLFERRLREITEMTAKAYGASAEFQWYPGSPAVVNDPAMAGLQKKQQKNRAF